MNKDEFIKKYHKYSSTKEEAEQEAQRINNMNLGFTVEAVDFKSFGYAIMLKEAVDYLKEIKVL